MAHLPSREERLSASGQIAEGDYIFQVTEVGDSDKSWPLTLALFNLDGTPVMSPSNEQQKTIKTWMPKSYGPFQESYIDTLLPEFAENGGEWKDDDLAGRWGLATIELRDPQEGRERFGKQPRVATVQPIPQTLFAQMAQIQSVVANKPAFIGSPQDLSGKKAAPGKAAAAPSAKPATAAAKPAAPAAAKPATAAAKPAAAAPAKPAAAKPAAAAAKANPFTG